jgi:hypothetical protein
MTGIRADVVHKRRVGKNWDKIGLCEYQITSYVIWDYLQQQKLRSYHFFNFASNVRKLKDVQRINNDSRSGQEKQHDEQKTVNQKRPQIPKSRWDCQVSPIITKDIIELELALINVI